MEKNEVLQLTQEFLKRLGGGAKPAEIASLFSENMEWEVAGDVGVLPWIGKRSGRNSVVDFLVKSSELIDRVSFEIQDVLAGERRSVILGTLVSKVRRNGKVIKTDFAIVLTIASGEIVRFQMFEDSFAVSRAAR
jgi:ketosteroid isomerase-like protein